MPHQHAQRMRRLAPHDGARRVARALHERPLQLREERLHKVRDPLQHRPQRAQDRRLHPRGVRRRLRRHPDQRPRERHDERLDRALLRPLHEVADRVRRLLPLVVVPRDQPRDGDRDEGRDTLRQAEPGDVDTRSTEPFDGPADRDCQRLELIFRYRLDEDVQCVPCRCVHSYMWIVETGYQLSDPVHAVQGRVEFRALAEDGEEVVGANSTLR